MAAILISVVFGPIMEYECGQYWDAFYKCDSPYVDSGGSQFNYRYNPNFSFGYATAGKTSVEAFSQPRQPVQEVGHSIICIWGVGVLCGGWSG